MRRLAVAGLVGAVLLTVAAPLTTADAAPSPRAPSPVTPKLASKLDRLDGGDSVRVIVRLRSDLTTDAVERLEEVAGPIEVETRLDLMDGLATTLTKDQVAELASASDVAAVEEDLPVMALNGGAQSSSGVTKARLDLPGLDGDADGDPNSYSTDDLVAAVVDTGIDASHLDLDEGKVIGFTDLVNFRQTPYDDSGHGTHVAASIAGDGDARSDHLHQGVAPRAALVGVKVLDSTGYGYMSTVAAGVEWVVSNRMTYGIEAINISIAATGCSDGTDATSRAVNNAVAAGLVVVVAAGNAGPGACTIGSPAAAAGAITVGAMADSTALGFNLAAFSSRGPTADGRVKPDISAPGVDITSARAGTVNGYATWGGTSTAAPFVAGVSLLLREANPALSPGQVKAVLTDTAVDWGAPGPDNEYGAGRLDAHRAITTVARVTGAAPVVPTHLTYTGSLQQTGSWASFPLQIDSTTAPIAVTLILPGAGSGDLDVELLGPDGTQLAVADTDKRQEELGYQPTVTGQYTVRVWSYAGSGAYLLDVSAPTGETFDRTAPRVDARSPDPAVLAALSTNVSATFSEAMDPATITLSLERVGGEPVLGTAAWSGTTITFDPTADLQPRTLYTASIATSGTDLAGNRLPGRVSWTFTTGTSATPPPSATVAVTKAPRSVTVLEGTLKSGTASRLAGRDVSNYQVSSTTRGVRAAAWYGEFTRVPNSLTSLRVSFAGSATRSCQNTLSVWNWSTNGWVTVDVQAGSSVSAFDVPVPGQVSDYVRGTRGNGEVRVRRRCSGGRRNFISSSDFLQLRYSQPA